MKVKELIAKLQEFDQDKEVWILDDDLPVASEPVARAVNEFESDYFAVREDSICISTF